MESAGRDIDALAAGVRRYFDERPSDVLAAYIFGSRARGTARATSDLDVAILRARPTARGFQGLPLDLETQLEAALGLPVQVVDLAAAPADLVHRVLRDGRLVVDRDPARRIAFEVQRRNEYFDLLPILRQYRRPAQPARSG